METSKALFTGVISSFAGFIVVSYLLGMANLGFSGFIPAVVALTPPILLIGAFVGVLAHVFNLKGCSILLIAPIAGIVGSFANATSSEEYHKSFMTSAIISVAFGVGTGILLLLLALGVRRLR